MSGAGIHGRLYEGGSPTSDVLVIGTRVPRLHHSDGKPVYFVTEHARGAFIHCRDGRTRRLLAYPSHYAGPAGPSRRSVYARHELLPWDAPIPCFDDEAPQPDSRWRS